MSRRRLDAEDFDPDAVDAEGLPLVYNERKITQFWGGRLRDLAVRWTVFGGISGGVLSLARRLFRAGCIPVTKAQGRSIGQDRSCWARVHLLTSKLT